MARLRTLVMLALLGAGGCTSNQTLGLQNLGTQNNPPNPDGSCQMGLTNCNNLCVDTSTSSTNCGKCGFVCQQGSTCSGGICGGAGQCGADLRPCCPGMNGGAPTCGQGLICLNGT